MHTVTKPGPIILAIILTLLHASGLRILPARCPWFPILAKVEVVSCPVAVVPPQRHGLSRYTLGASTYQLKPSKSTTGAGPGTPDIYLIGTAAG